MAKTKISLLCFLSAAGLLVAAQAWADANINKPSENKAGTAFTTVIDDLPLMPGLEPVEEKDVLFLTDTGRIAETVATGSVDVDDVYHFYQRSLPQLGWKKIDARTFARDGEILHLDVSSVTPKATTIARFSVEPVRE